MVRSGVRRVLATAAALLVVAGAVFFGTEATEAPEPHAPSLPPTRPEPRPVERQASAVAPPRGSFEVSDDQLPQRPVPPERPTGAAPPTAGPALESEVDLDDAGSSPAVVAVSAIDSPEDAGEASAIPDAGPGRVASADDRSPFRIRWGEEGYCGPRRNEDLRASKEALFARFVARTIGEAELLADPRIDGATLALIAERLQAARRVTSSWLDWPSNVRPPQTVVYADTEQLQSVSCVSAQTIGYFDGRIHVSADPALGQRMISETVIHEYCHFALVRLGVQKPMWLHEGLAMHLAEESWFATSSIDFARWLRSSQLPFAAMVYAFPHVAEERLALAATYQSYRMVDFLLERKGPEGPRELTRLLGAGLVTPDDAFARGTGLSDSELDAHWKRFVTQ